MSDHRGPDDTTPQARLLAEMADTLVAMGETPVDAEAKALLIPEELTTVGPGRRWGGLHAEALPHGLTDYAGQGQRRLVPRQRQSGRAHHQRAWAIETSRASPDAEQKTRSSNMLGIPSSWTALVEELCQEGPWSEPSPGSRKVLH